MRLPMSAIGTKQTWTSALHMSAFGGKADMTIAVRDVRLRPKADIGPDQRWRGLCQFPTHRPVAKC
jgi:hypothetical protein